jgi:hypothetical protein
MYKVKRTISLVHFQRTFGDVSALANTWNAPNYTFEEYYNDGKCCIHKLCL